MGIENGKVEIIQGTDATGNPRDEYFIECFENVVDFVTNQTILNALGVQGPSYRPTLQDFLDVELRYPDIVYYLHYISRRLCNTNNKS